MGGRLLARSARRVGTKVLAISHSTKCSLKSMVENELTEQYVFLTLEDKAVAGQSYADGARLAMPTQNCRSEV